MGRNNTKLKRDVENRKGLVSFVPRARGPLRECSGELSVTGKCQGVERQDVSRALSLPVPKTEKCANFHPLGEREEGILGRGGVSSKISGLSPEK